MRKLLGEAAVAHARATGAQLYCDDEAVSLEEAQRVLRFNPGSVSCDGGGGYTCPHCERTSYHPRDLAERYCGACHRFEAA